MKKGALLCALREINGSPTFPLALLKVRLESLIIILSVYTSKYV
nr:MAG TPA: hypothetical protein [Caudoviricetes sp.]